MFRELDSIIPSSLEKHGVRPGHIEADNRDISYRAALHLIDLRHEEAIDRQEIIASF